MTKHPLGEEHSPKVQSELHLTQRHSTPSGPIAGHQREEISSSSFPVPLEEGADCEEGTLSLPFDTALHMASSNEPMKRYQV